MRCGAGSERKAMLATTSGKVACVTSSRHLRFVALMMRLTKAWRL